MNFDVVKQNLENRGFGVCVFETALEAAEYLVREIVGKSVGFGGSVTLEQMALYEKLSERNTVSWHHRIPENMTRQDVIKRANASQIYLSSVNGLAETGEIINIDNTGNRVGAIFYGHEKVYLVVGVNKIARDYDGALWRARNIASPLNARRLNRKTPCAVNADRCYDCNSPDRICRGLSVLWECPAMADIEVVLINENLGY